MEGSSFQTKLKPVNVQDTLRSLQRAPGSHSCPQLPQAIPHSHFPAGFKRTTAKAQYKLMNERNKPSSFHLCLAAPDRIDTTFDLDEKEFSRVAWRSYRQAVPKPQTEIANQNVHLALRSRLQQADSFPKFYSTRVR